MYQRLIEKERQENQCNNFYVRKTSLDLGSIALMSLSFVCSVNHQFEYTPHLLNESSTTLKKNYRMLLFSCYIYSFPIVKFFSLRKENGSKRKNVNLTVERSILLCHSTSFRSDLPDFTISI